MAALTNIDTTNPIFGAKGAYCPATLMKRVDYNRTIDFADANVSENKNYEILPIPKGFLIEFLAVEQLTAVSDQEADRTVTFATKNADTAAIGGNYVLESSKDGTMLRSCQPATSAGAYAASSSAGSPTTSISIPGAYFSSAADTLCLKVPDGLTGDKLTAGKIVVHMIGYQTFGESLGDIASGTPAFATGQTNAQAANNVSGGDPMFH